MMTHLTLVEILKKKDVELFRIAMRILLENQFRNQEKNLSVIANKQNGINLKF